MPVSWFEPGQDGSSKRSLVRFHPTGNEDEGDLLTKVKEKDTLPGKCLNLNGFQIQPMYGESADPCEMMKQDKEIERLQQEIIRLRTK